VARQLGVWCGHLLVIDVASDCSPSLIADLRVKRSFHERQERRKRPVLEEKRRILLQAHSVCELVVPGVPVRAVFKNCVCPIGVG
jgi:hypothetical protein